MTNVTYLPRRTAAEPHQPVHQVWESPTGTRHIVPDHEASRMYAIEAAARHQTVLRHTDRVSTIPLLMLAVVVVTGALLVWAVS